MVKGLMVNSEFRKFRQKWIQIAFDVVRLLDSLNHDLQRRKKAILNKSIDAVVT